MVQAMFDFDNVMKAYEDNPLFKFRKLTEFEGIPRLLFGDCKSMIQNIAWTPALPCHFFFASYASNIVVCVVYNVV